MPITLRNLNTEIIRNNSFRKTSKRTLSRFHPTADFHKSANKIGHTWFRHFLKIPPKIFGCLQKYRHSSFLIQKGTTENSVPLFPFPVCNQGVWCRIVSGTATSLLNGMLILQNPYHHSFSDSFFLQTVSTM